MSGYRSYQIHGGENSTAIFRVPAVGLPRNHVSHNISYGAFYDYINKLAYLLLADKRTTELKTHIYRFDNVNDECNGLSPQALLKGFSSRFHLQHLLRPTSFNFPKNITPISQRSNERIANCDLGCMIRIPNQIRSTEIRQRDNTPSGPAANMMLHTQAG